MDRPEDAGRSHEQDERERIMNGLKSTSGQAPSVGVEEGHFDHTTPQCPSSLSDDGTETYHSLEGELVMIEHDQYHEQNVGNPPVVTATILKEEHFDQPDYKSESAEDAYEYPTELSQALETEQEETVTSFIVNPFEDDNGRNLQDPTYELEKSSAEKTIHQLPLEPPTSSGSSTSGSMNNVEAVLTAEAMENSVFLPEVEVVDVPGSLKLCSESNDSPKLPEKYDEESRGNNWSVEINDGQAVLEHPLPCCTPTTPDILNSAGAVMTAEGSKVGTMDDVGIELSATESQSEISPKLPYQYSGETQTADQEFPKNVFQSPRICCIEEGKMQALQFKNEKYGKTIMVPGVSDPRLAQDEIYITPLDMELSCAEHLQELDIQLEDEGWAFEPDRKSKVTSYSSVTHGGVDELNNHRAAVEKLAQYYYRLRSDHEEKNPGSSKHGPPGQGHSFMMAQDEMKGGGISNQCFQTDEAHSITTCETNSCHRGIVCAPNDNDLDSMGTFQNQNYQSRNTTATTGTELDEIVVLPLPELDPRERENVSGQKTSKVVFGNMEDELDNIEVENIGKPRKQLRRTERHICCSKKKRLIFFVAALAIFCLIMILKLRGPDHE